MPQTPEEREDRAKFLASKRDANASAADAYRARQAVMVAEARELINSLDRVPADERHAALTQALSDLPERGAAQPRRVLEEALEKSGGWTPVSEPEVTESETPDPVPDDYDAEAVHAEAVSRLHAVVTASKAAQDQAHAESVAAAREAVEGKTNPFAGLVIPDPVESPVSVDDAYAAHLAREAAEERHRAAQEMRDASPKRRVKPATVSDDPENPFNGWVTGQPIPEPAQTVNTADERAKVEAGFRAFMAEVTAEQGVTST